MKIFLHKNFSKKYGRLRQNEKNRFKERRNLFLEDPYNPLLNNHPLAGKYTGCRSINVTGDLRVIYDTINKDSVLFIDIDTHSNLYK
ncbi:MAG: type II toxin-antitoxin system mRNA interferase toxin, RelE/StbE family [bacterium]